MVKKGAAVLLVLGLVTAVSVLYVTFEVRTSEFGSFYQPDFVSDTERTLQVSEPLFRDKNCTGGELMYGRYCVISPYEASVRNTSKAGSVTLCTQGTVEFLQHVVVLCHRWSGPISVAVYSPQEDYPDARVVVQLLRQCDFCVKHWVDWHFFFPSDNDLPSIDPSQLLRDCSSIPHMKKAKKRKSRGIYPINVGRNVARRLASTPFVFSSDIELYPSLNIPAMFERMVRSRVPNASDNQVWVLPVFEVPYYVRAPLLKSRLRSLFDKRQAISFHQYRCNICHRIPNLTKWMSHGEDTPLSELEESLEPLKIWTTVKRNRQFKLHEWEPFFIGTTKDPEFDIRLSWEGKQNKMQVAFEMCMRNYDFHIVENAFLVHTPGINVYNSSKEKDRAMYLSQNRKVINTVKRKLFYKYRLKNCF